ncbi:hypothetical protein [Burkholderia vietnamiensis]|uniref:hypothetical protein n=1 Tax=Burkholderia vietnamiensis TaxID=60552 RepID=UPI001588A657|nr:hypothetical protein [Burkholderia vietnamiensis]
MDELIRRLNSLQVYPTLPELHKLAIELTRYTPQQIEVLIAALTNTVLANDVRLLTGGALPSTLTAPIATLETPPSDPRYPVPDTKTDPASATGEPPTIKPKQ